MLYDPTHCFASVPNLRIFLFPTGFFPIPDHRRAQKISLMKRAVEDFWTAAREKLHSFGRVSVWELQKLWSDHSLQGSHQRLKRQRMPLRIIGLEKNPPLGETILLVNRPRSSKMNSSSEEWTRCGMHEKPSGVRSSTFPYPLHPELSGCMRRSLSTKPLEGRSGSAWSAFMLDPQCLTELWFGFAQQTPFHFRAVSSSYGGKSQQTLILLYQINRLETQAPEWHTSEE